MHAMHPARRATGLARAGIPRDAAIVTALVGLVILPLTACGGASGNANGSPTVPALAISASPGAGAGSTTGTGQGPGSGHESSSARSALGGAAGILLGTAATAGYAISYGQPTVIPPVAPAAGMALALGIGALAGVYPAAKAARLPPAGALRAA